MAKKNPTQNEGLLICSFRVYDLQQLYLLPSDSALDSARLERLKSPCCAGSVGATLAVRHF